MLRQASFFPVRQVGFKLSSYPYLPGPTSKQLGWTVNYQLARPIFETHDEQTWTWSWNGCYPTFKSALVNGFFMDVWSMLFLSLIQADSEKVSLQSGSTKHCSHLTLTCHVSNEPELIFVHRFLVKQLSAAMSCPPSLRKKYQCTHMFLHIISACFTMEIIFF